MKAIQINHITKRYGNVAALEDLSFSFEYGKIYGVLGRNGAGKSTLINIIANRLFADEGEVLIDGLPAKENMAVHEKLFCMSDQNLYDSNLKIRDIFKWTGRFYDQFQMDQACEIAEMYSLDTKKRFPAVNNIFCQNNICSLYETIT